jgi:uncharacterized protein YecT (DUF1311 family)
MRVHRLAFVVMLVATLPSAAHAIDCARASSPTEHTICDDPTLIRADAAMSRAYSAILKAAPDPEIHAMLVTSQKRWIAAREKSFGSTERTGKASLRAAQRFFVLDATEGRTKSLSQISNQAPMQPYMVQVALKQRRFAAQFTGGPFAGFDTACDFFPDGGAGESRSYACFATHHLQNNDRICSPALDWATYRIYASGSVANIVDGKPKLVATCKADGCDDDTNSADAGWNNHPDAASAVTFAQSLPKLDAEVMDSMVDDEPSWLAACLTDRQFPPAESRK